MYEWLRRTPLEPQDIFSRAIVFKKRAKQSQVCRSPCLDSSFIRGRFSGTEIGPGRATTTIGRNKALEKPPRKLKSASLGSTSHRQGAPHGTSLMLCGKCVDFLVKQIPKGTVCYWVIFSRNEPKSGLWGPKELLLGHPRLV